MVSSNTPKFWLIPGAEDRRMDITAPNPIPSGIWAEEGISESSLVESGSKRMDVGHKMSPKRKSENGRTDEGEEEIRVGRMVMRRGWMNTEDRQNGVIRTFKDGHFDQPSSKFFLRKFKKPKRTFDRW